MMICPPHAVPGRIRAAVNASERITAAAINRSAAIDLSGMAANSKGTRQIALVTGLAADRALRRLGRRARRAGGTFWLVHDLAQQLWILVPGAAYMAGCVPPPRESNRSL